MSLVALVFCPSYDEEEVERALWRGLSFFGGPEALCPGARRVLLKPNLLVGEVPERAVTTHPSVFQAVAKVLRKAGYRVGFGDSPAFGSFESVARKTGILGVAQSLGVEVADFVCPVSVNHPQGVQHKRFEIARGVKEYDALISLPKWKTHGLTRITGAVKNQLGCIPGIRKGELHFRIPDAVLFSRMLVDLNHFLRPSFFIMDAVVAMEGNGPRNGKPRFMKLLALSQDPVALDATLSRLVHLDPSLVPTCSEGERLGLGVWREEAIELCGDDWERFEQKDFAVIREPDISSKKSPFLPFVRHFLLPYPAVQNELCKRCGVCVEVCPARPRAMVWEVKTSPPFVQYGQCIRCFVCQEVCPHGAIRVLLPLMRRMFTKIA